MELILLIGIVLSVFIVARNEKRYSEQEVRELFYKYLDESVTQRRPFKNIFEEQLEDFLKRNLKK